MATKASASTLSLSEAAPKSFLASNWEPNAPLTEQQQAATVSLSCCRGVTFSCQFGQENGLSVPAKENGFGESHAIKAVLVKIPMRIPIRRWRRSSKLRKMVGKM